MPIKINNGKKTNKLVQINMDFDANELHNKIKEIYFKAF